MQLQLFSEHFTDPAKRPLFAILRLGDSKRTNINWSLSLSFFAIELILISLWLPVGIWLSVLAGFLFGTWLGAAVVCFAATAGSVIAFLSARYLFADSIRRWAARSTRLERALDAIDRGFQTHGPYYVLLLRLTPIFPFWLLNIGLALTSVRLRDYWWTSMIGMIPVTLAICNAGSAIAEISSFREVISIRVLIALGLFPVMAIILHRLANHFRPIAVDSRCDIRGEMHDITGKS